MLKQSLLITVLSVFLLGCSTSSEQPVSQLPTPDVEATVSARINSMNIPATVEAMVENRLANAPTPIPQEVVKEVVKEVFVQVEKVVEVEKIVEVIVTATPTPTPAQVLPTPTPTVAQVQIAPADTSVNLSGYTCESIIDEYIEVTKDKTPWVNEMLLSDPPMVLVTSDKRLICLGDATLNTGDTLMVQFSTFIDSNGVRWVGGRVAPFANVSMRYTDGKGNYRTE